MFSFLHTYFYIVEKLHVYYLKTLSLTDTVFTIEEKREFEEIFTGEFELIVINVIRNVYYAKME